MQILKTWIKWIVTIVLSITLTAGVVEKFVVNASLLTVMETVVGLLAVLFVVDILDYRSHKSGSQSRWLRLVSEWLSWKLVYHLRFTILIGAVLVFLYGLVVRETSIWHYSVASAGLVTEFFLTTKLSKKWQRIQS